MRGASHLSLLRLRAMMLEHTLCLLPFAALALTSGLFPSDFQTRILYVEYIVWMGRSFQGPSFKEYLNV